MKKYYDNSEIYFRAAMNKKKDNYESPWAETDPTAFGTEMCPYCGGREICKKECPEPLFALPKR